MRTGLEVNTNDMSLPTRMFYYHMRWAKRWGVAKHGARARKDGHVNIVKTYAFLIVCILFDLVEVHIEQKEQ